MSTDTSLSQVSFMEKLEEDPDKLSISYIIELLIGLLFCALKSIEKKYEYPTAGEIMDGVRTEFIKHTKIQFNDVTDDQVNLFIVQRFKEYEMCSDNQSGGGAWHLGKQYYWNIIDQKKEDVTAVMFSETYMLEGMELIDSILQDYKVSG
jgi:hypothetical protein